MLYKLWNLIQVWLPYWVILKIYEQSRALPAKIRTKSGRNLKAIMITTEYGILFTERKYVHNRLKKLREKQLKLENINTELANEINNLSFEAREMMYRGLDDKN